MISRRQLLGGMLSACAVRKSSGEVPPEHSVIDIGSQRQLLFDDFLLSMGSPKTQDIPYGIRWVLGRAEKSSRMSLLAADQPWESETYWVCLLHDGGKYR